MTTLTRDAAKLVVWILVALALWYSAYWTIEQTIGWLGQFGIE